MAQSLTAAWQEIQTALEKSSDGLLHACDRAREGIEDLWSELEADLGASAPPTVEPGRLDSLRTLCRERSGILLFAPRNRRRSLLPQRRAIEAFEAYLQELTRIVEQAPQEVAADEEEAARCFGRRSAGAVLRRWLRREPAVVRLPLRDALRRTLARRRRRLLLRTGRVLLRLTQLEDALPDPWEATLEEGLRQLDGTGADAKEYEHDKRRWLALGQRLRRDARLALAALRETLATLPEAAAAEAARSRARTRGLRSGASDALERIRRRVSGGPQDRTRECVAFWVRREQAIDKLFELSVAQVHLGEQLADAGTTVAERLDRERRSVLGELDRTAQALSAWNGELNPDFLPSTEVLPKGAGERIRDWSAEARRVAATLLPEEAELADPRGVLPPWLAPWRPVRPMDALLAGLESVSEPSRLPGLDGAERLHRSVVAEIDHARQVVFYGLAAAADEAEPKMAREAVANALDLLNRRRSGLEPSVEPAEADLTEASAAMLSRCAAAVAEGRLGLIRWLARRRAPRLAAEVGNRAAATLRRALRWTWMNLGAAQRWVLIHIGWDRPPETRLAPVDRRPRLQTVPSRSLPSAELPLIYARLFRPEPVRDPRFLIGRREEMEALRECRRSWEDGRPTALLIVGERGSGKTSLINCARADAFKALPVVSAAFDKRITSAEDMEAFLRETFGLPERADLIDALRAEPRVAILEELERAFLRRIGGFDGMRRLLSVVSKTKHSVLWCVAVNQSGFRLADAAIGVNRGFSHRINARAVSAEHLREAILQRHDLSGMALRFRSTARASPFRDVRAFLGLERSSEEEFFNALYDQSRGVFRSAFQLWRAAMTVAADGLRLQTPDDPDMDGMRASLAVEDLFALHAVLQHGALTAEEHSEIFGAAIEDSIDRLDRLSEMGMLEAEMDLGLRIRPEAAHLVRSLLDGSNLM